MKKIMILLAAFCCIDLNAAPYTEVRVGQVWAHHQMEQFSAAGNPWASGWNEMPMVANTVTCVSNGWVQFKISTVTGDSSTSSEPISFFTNAGNHLILDVDSPAYQPWPGTNADFWIGRSTVSGATCFQTNATTSPYFVTTTVTTNYTINEIVDGKTNVIGTVSK
jgi:hypothetical protein